MTTERQAVIESPLWVFLEVENREDAKRFRARFGDPVPGPLTWEDWQTAVRHLRGLWNIYFWLRQVERGELDGWELRAKLRPYLRASGIALRHYPTGEGRDFLMRVTQDLARLLGKGMGGYTVDAMAPGRIALRRAPRTLLERMHGDLFSAIATRMEAAECGSSDCSVIFLRSDPRQRFCGSTCKNREAQRARRRRAA